MPHIFISYSRVDREFAERLIGHLRRNPRYQVWYDDSLHGGDHWWEEILDQIGDCDVFIYLLSNDSITSPYCQGEFTEARRLKKMVVTVQVRDRTRRSGELEAIQYVDMTAGANDGAALANLFGSIEYQAQHLPKRRPKPLSEERTPRPKITVDEDTSNLNSNEETSLPTIAPKSLEGDGRTRHGNRLLLVGAVFILFLVAIGASVLLTRFNLPNSLASDTATPTPTPIAFSVRIYTPVGVYSEPSSKASIQGIIYYSENITVYSRVIETPLNGNSGNTWYFVIAEIGGRKISGYVISSSIQLSPLPNNPNITPPLITLTPTPV